MAIIERQLATESGSATRPPRPQVPKREFLPLGVAWLVLFPLALALEPAAAAPATIPLWEWAVSLVLLTGLGATAAGLGLRRTWGATASLFTSTVFTAGVFACPATGHHAFGLWWFGEFGAAIALVALSAAAVLRSRRAPS
jgi:hypothetical protein